MSDVRLEIVSDKKLDWSYLKKVTLMLKSETLVYETPLSVAEIHRIHFITGALLADYYSQDKP